MPITKPIFIVGTGRCGSTLFHDVLCQHEELGWLTQLVAKYPHRPQLNAMAMKALQTPLISALVRNRFYPSEPYSFWERYCPGFSRPFRDILDTDVTPRVSMRIHSAVEKSIPDDLRFIAKITGWPRVSYLEAIFPDAVFIHIIRDGRAVVNSVISAPFFDGWTGPSQWARGELNEVQHKAWMNSGKSFIVLAAIGWENRMNAFDATSKKMNKENYMEIKYEEFCDKPRDTLEQVLKFIGISPNESFFNDVNNNFKLKNQNDKWKTDLSEIQQYLLDDYLGTSLKIYGYK
jgi:hypothetical protein